MDEIDRERRRMAIRARLLGLVEAAEAPPLPFTESVTHRGLVWTLSVTSVSEQVALRLTQCKRDILVTLLEIAPNGKCGEDLKDLMEELGRIHGLSTVKAALPQLRRDGLVDNVRAGLGYTLTPAGEAMARTLTRERSA